MDFCQSLLCILSCMVAEPDLLEAPPRLSQGQFFQRTLDLTANPFFLHENPLNPTDTHLHQHRFILADAVAQEITKKRLQKKVINKLIHKEYKRQGLHKFIQDNLTIVAKNRKELQQKIGGWRYDKENIANKGRKFYTLLGFLSNLVTVELKKQAETYDALSIETVHAHAAIIFEILEHELLVAEPEKISTAEKKYAKQLLTSLVHNDQSNKPNNLRSSHSHKPTFHQKETRRANKVCNEPVFKQSHR